MRIGQEKSDESSERDEAEGFGQRLREAFGGARNVEIARILGVTEGAVRNYIDGRVPPAETLILIAERTNCTIDWLLRGRGQRQTGSNPIESILTVEEIQAVKELAASAGEEFEVTLRRVVRDQLQALGKLESAPMLVEYYGGEWAEIPLLGQVAAGAPIETFDPPGERVRVIKTWPDSKKAYALRVTGDSMQDDGINDGDLIVCVQASEASPGQLVVALIDGDKATVKRFHRQNGTVILRPANAAHEAQTYKASRVRIQGLVESIVRTNR